MPVCTSLASRTSAFGRTPAALGTTGSVRALVPIANERGFYRGWHFAKRDGMHFEIATS